MGETGLEPAPVLPDNDLNVARIPFRHLPSNARIIANMQVVDIEESQIKLNVWANQQTFH